MSLADLSMWFLLCLGAGVLIVAAIGAVLAIHPLTAPRVAIYARLLWSPVAKWGGLALLVLGALAGLVLAVARWLTGGGPPDGIKVQPAPDPVPSSDEAREAIREETRREVAEIESLGAKPGITIGELERRFHEQE